MPNPIVPSAWKALINSLTGPMCERMAKLFQTVQLKAQEHEYKYNEAGLPTDEYKADLCEALADCIGTGDGDGDGEPPNPLMAAPEALSASDDAYSDKIVIDWEPVTGATQYKLYRSLTTSFSGATLIATITAPTILYNDPVDGDLVAGTKYYYWARATDGTNTSALSNRDQGRAATEGEIGVLPDISDLRVGYGFGAIVDSISLVWTPPAGATKYDVYRHTANNFSAATKIYSNKSPSPTTSINPLSYDPVFWDNVGEVVLYDTPPSDSTDFYYWVVAKGDSPPSTSEESNVGLGRVLPPAIYNIGSETLDYGVQSTVVPVGATKAWLVLYGSGGGGSGGGVAYGGSGGGGGGLVRVALTGLTPGDVVELTPLTGVNSGNAPSETDGTDGEVIELYIDSVLTAIANPGLGGIYSVVGTGDGGDGGDANAMVGSPVAYTGKSGLPNVGADGGRSGYTFGGRRVPMADGSVGGGFTGDSFAGSGAKAVPFNPALSVGGYGLTGKAYITWGS